MTDLFTRLAERALAETRRVLEATAVPEPGPLGDDDEQTVMAEPGSTTPATEPDEGPDRSGAPPPGRQGRQGPAGQTGGTGRDGSTVHRLVPVPAVVPAAPERPASAGAADRVETPRSRPPEVGADGVRRPQPSRSAPALRPAPSPPLPVPAAPRTSEPTEPPAAPPLEITVGRIEIRVRPSAPADTDRGDQPAPRARPGTALTLEEYLRRREAAT